MVEGEEEASVEVEAEGVTHEGSADIGMDKAVTVQSIVADVPRVKLAELTKADPTLDIAL